jgi:ribosomal protein S18 acetylase RimI-like enzyme
VRLVAYDAAEAAELAEPVHALFAEEYPPGPAFVEWRDGLWSRHRARPGFELIVAHAGDRIAGVVWGYIGDRGQYWSDAVAASLPPDVADAWVGGHLEVVELIVADGYRRRGVGRALLTSLVQRSSASRAMLSVRDSASPARALYRSLGWRELGRLGTELTVLGLVARGPGG